MELRIPDRIQSKLPYAFLSRPSTISTPSICLCAKIASCTLNLCSAKQHIKFVIEKSVKFSAFALWGFVIQVHGEYSSRGSGNSCSEQSIAALLNRVYVFGVVGAFSFFNMLLVVENANTDLPPIGFCIVFLLGSKYDGLKRSKLCRTCLADAVALNCVLGK
jgi:hypothetical protein